MTTLLEVETAQEPVAWIYTSKLAGNQQYITRYRTDLSTYQADKVWPLYTTPPAAPAQKPVAWLIDWPDEPDLGHYFSEVPTDTGRNQPLYTTPPAAQCEWVGLTNEEIDDMWDLDGSEHYYYAFARAIEVKLREKNTGESK